MPQSALEYIRGFANLTFDTLTQRARLPAAIPHPVFQSDDEYLRGKTIIITGANSGIGLETARMLASAGASIVLACRNFEKAANAVDDIRNTHPKARLEVSRLDLADLSSVRSFAHDFSPRPLHALILNGGVMGVDHTIPESHFTVNHIGHVLLTLLLLRSLNQVGGRIIPIVSLTMMISDLHWDDLSFEKRPYNWMTGYANSKLCMLLFMQALKIHLVGSKIQVSAVDPGEATSDVARNLGRVWMGLHKNVGKLFLLNIEESARTPVYVAGAREADGHGHVYYRINEMRDIPARFLKPADIEIAWKVSLDYAGVEENDLSILQEVTKSGTDSGNQ